VKRNYYNLVKYEWDLATDKKRWLGPRGKALSGVDKQLARLAWDRKRLKA
jgi:hypothetical protein